MSNNEPRQSRGLLATELALFIRLRWAAGIAVLIAAWLSHLRWSWLAWYGNAGRVAFIGADVLVYNAVLWLLLRYLRNKPRNRRALLALAWGQLLLDLSCLTILNLLTGGINSPLRGFFVFHMIFASLLLPRQMAYGGAGLAMLLLTLGLWVTGQWPDVARDSASMLAWVIMLLLTVWLTNGVTLHLRRQNRRLSKQNKRISTMSRTLRKQQRAMIQQEKMAAAGRMAAGVAHEIANPLASMDGLLQLMERRPEKLRPGAIATLREQIARISQIVRRMTTFAHPGEGEWQIKPLNDVVSKATEVLRFDPRWKKAVIAIELSPDMPAIRMLPEGVQQVVINLVINALDAMEQAPEPRLIIRTFHSDGFCSLEVTDNGHGISKENKAHLFEPFFTTKPVGKGTGLGLSITYTILKTHGGEIDVQSTPGEGACFTIRFPAIPSHVSAVREDAPLVANSPEKPGEL